jgi:hypothetical protein
MLLLIRNHKKKFIAGTVLLLLLVIGPFPFPVTQGRLKARLDLSLGRHVVLGYGLPPPGRPEYERLLRERYGIEFRSIAACIISQEEREYADAYNAVSTEAAIRKFGRDIFLETAAEAEKNWEAARGSGNKW